MKTETLIIIFIVGALTGVSLRISIELHISPIITGLIWGLVMFLISFFFPESVQPEMPLGNLEYDELKNRIESIELELERESSIDKIIEFIKFIVTYISGLFSPYLSKLVEKKMKKAIKSHKRKK